MNFPAIQIRQQYGKIGIETSSARLNIQQSPATIEIHTIPARLEMYSPPGDLRIDQSQAQDALGTGSNLRWNLRIDGSCEAVAEQGIAKIVEDGNKCADISHNPNAFADIAGEEQIQIPLDAYVGDALGNNVKIDYVPHKPEIHVTNGNVDIQVHPNRLIMDYYPGNVKVYMLQYPKVEIIPPKVDVKI